MKNLGDILQQAQAMQADMQGKLAALTVEGTAGGGMVGVTLTGTGQMKAVRIDPAAFDPDEKEITEDLIVAAHNDAKTKLDAKMQEEAGKMLGGLQMPPGFNPFGQ